jgi:hypothetical protein
LLVCPHYDSSRTALFGALGFRPPDGDLIKICLGCAADKKLKGGKPSLYERYLTLSFSILLGCALIWDFELTLHTSSLLFS